GSGLDDAPTATRNEGLRTILTRFRLSAASSSDAWKLADGEDYISGDLEVLRDAQRQIEAGAVLSAFQVSDRLIVVAERTGEFATGGLAFGSEHRDAVVNGLCHSDSPLLCHAFVAGRHGRSRLAPCHSLQQFRCQDDTDDRPHREDD